MPRIKKYTIKKPYNTKGQSNFGYTKNKSGVYVIRENGKPVYVGVSTTNLYRTMHRHFQVWNHRGQEVVTYVKKLKRNSYTVSVALCAPGAALRLEKALQKHLKPRDSQPDNYVMTPAEKKAYNEYKAEQAKPLPF